MNTIKFSNIKNVATEQHDPSIIDWRTVDLFGRKISISNPCNLNIFITNRCHCRCSFCINRDYGGTDITDEEYGMSLWATIKSIRDAGLTDLFEITITGGEPCLSPQRLIHTMRLCTAAGIKCRTVSTTGIRLTEPVGYGGRPLYSHIIENGFTHNINISKMHWDPAINDRLMNGRFSMSMRRISDLAAAFKYGHADMRVSCNFLQGGIFNVEDMLEYISVMRSHGIETVMFRDIVGGEGKVKEIAVSDKLLINYTKIGSMTNETYTIDTYKSSEWLMKVYQHHDGSLPMSGVKVINPPSDTLNNISSFSLRNGVLTDGFGGNKIEIDMKRV